MLGSSQRIPGGGALSGRPTYDWCIRGNYVHCKLTCRQKSRTTSTCLLFSKINGGTGAEDQRSTAEQVPKTKERYTLGRWGALFSYSIHFNMKWLNTDAPPKTESTKRPRWALWDTGRYSSTRLDTSGRLASGNLFLLVEYCALSFSSAGSGGLQ